MFYYTLFIKKLDAKNDAPHNYYILFKQNYEMFLIIFWIWAFWVQQDKRGSIIVKFESKLENVLSGGTAMPSKIAQLIEQLIEQFTFFRAD